MKNWFSVFSLLNVATICYTFLVPGTDKSKYRINHDYSILSPGNISWSHWMLRQSADIEENQIVLTPAERDRRGSIWNVYPVFSTNWMIELTYTSYGPETEIADGMALWYLPYIPIVTGYHSTYGGPDPMFEGLMIAIDTYYVNYARRETLLRHFDESSVVVAYNKVPRMFSFVTEGYEIMSGRCLVTNRYSETNDTISTLVVIYLDSELSVYHKQGTNLLKICTSVHDIELPERGYLGVSATTGAIPGKFSIQSLKFYEYIFDTNGMTVEANLNEMAFILAVVGVAAMLLLFIITVTFVYFKRQNFLLKTAISLHEISKEKLLE